MKQFATLFTHGIRNGGELRQAVHHAIHDNGNPRPRRRVLHHQRLCRSVYLGLAADSERLNESLHLDSPIPYLRKLDLDGDLSAR